MLLWQKGIVSNIISSTQNKQIVEIINQKGDIRLGINYPFLTGVCKIDDEVFYNTTAVELKLGTGGFDFIVANITHPPLDREITSEHIMKNRYTPLQFAIQSGEELTEPIRVTKFNETLAGTPVLIISLHSMLPILTLLIKQKKPQSNIVYVMTDSTSLPIWISDHVQALREQKLLKGTVSTGNSFGGDIEAINKFSGLLMAKDRLDADIIIIGAGPGSVGTGTEWGYSAIEVGEIVNAVNILLGKPIIVPRISFYELRRRHYGLSHHLITALSKVALTSAYLPLPILEESQHCILSNQMMESKLNQKHYIEWMTPPTIDEIEHALSPYNKLITTMGRGIDLDPAFFQAVSIVAEFSLLIKPT